MQGNTRFDESLLSDKRKQQYEQERLQGERAELGEMAYVCALACAAAFPVPRSPHSTVGCRQAAREREAASMARILGLVNKSMDKDAG